MTYKVTQRSIARLMKNAEWISFRHSLDLISGIEYGYSGSFGQSFRKVSDTLFAPVQVELV